EVGRVVAAFEVACGFFEGHTPTGSPSRKGVFAGGDRFFSLRTHPATTTNERGDFGTVGRRRGVGRGSRGDPARTIARRNGRRGRNGGGDGARTLRARPGFGRLYRERLHHARHGRACLS